MPTRIEQSSSRNEQRQPRQQLDPGRVNVDFALKNPLTGNMLSTNVPLDQSRDILSQLAEQGIVGFTQTSYGPMVTSISINGVTLSIDPKSNRVIVTNSDGTYYYDSSEPIGFSFFRQETGKPNAPLESFFTLELGKVVELGPDKVQADALRPTEAGKKYRIIAEVSGAHAESKAEELKKVGDDLFVSTADASRRETSYDTVIPSEELYSSSNVSILQIDPRSMFNLGLRHFSRLSYNVQRSLASIVLPAMQRAYSLRRMLLPSNLYQLTELELARRQRVLEQSAQRRVQKMLLFDAAPPSFQNGGVFPASENFDSPAPASQFSNLNFFPDAPAAPSFDYSGDFGSPSGGERMKSGTKAENKQKNADSRVSNGNATSKVSNAVNTSVKTQVSASSKTQNALSTKASAKESTSVKNANAHSLKTQTPISEGKTRVQQPAQTLQSNAKAQQAGAVIANGLRAAMQSPETIVPNAQTTNARATNETREAIQAQAAMQISQTMQSNVSAQPIQTENAQYILNAQVQNHVQAENAQQTSNAQLQEQISNANAELQIQIPEIAQMQTPQVAAQQRAKKASKAKIVALQPIIISSNGDDKGNKKENSMNEEKTEAHSFQLIPIAPRRVIPQAVAFLPLRSLFERKGKTKEKHECASKVCASCGRKAA